MCGKFKAPLQLLLLWASISTWFWTNRGSANQPKMVYFMPKNANSCIWGHTIPDVLDKLGCLPICSNFKIFASISCTKSKLKENSVLLKNLPTHVFEAPQCGLFQTNGGLYQSAQNRPIFNFLNNFMYKIKIQRGQLIWKKLI